jgi:hypothetical protein
VLFGLFKVITGYPYNDAPDAAFDRSRFPLELAAKVYWATLKTDGLKDRPEQRASFTFHWNDFYEAFDAAEPDPSQCWKLAEGEGKISWLVPGFIVAGGFAAIYSEPFAGKSFTALSLCCCIATGRPWFGFPIKQGRAFYLSAESGKEAFEARTKAWLATLPADERAEAERLLLAISSANAGTCF